ncbi:MAG: aconitate hydratase, partial [Actinomycetota bacterium]
YFGPGTETISATGKATICNMGAEIGATTSVFSYDDHAAGYLKATGREAIADAAAKVIDHLRTDADAYDYGEVVFDQLIEIDLSELEPQINGPHSPDLAHPVSRLGADARAAGWPLEISSALIGSCTNSSYEDITRTASIARQAAAAGIRVKTPLLVTPGSERVRATIERDGLLADLEAIGATVLANACGPCIGQWQRDDVTPDDVNVIVTSYNRNFPKRNDGSANTLCFVTSPETVMAFALHGNLDVDPRNDLIQGIKLDDPVGQELPSAGFEAGDDGFIAPPADGSSIDVVVDPLSDRLQLLEPFAAWDGKDFIELPILLKAKGKCTTDHISAAGPWLKYRGHLENISGNLFLGAINAYTGAAGEGRSFIDGETHTFPDIAKAASLSNIPWVAVGDENWGEGSSREHAAMEPRYRGCRSIIVRSFARIHETNLKKQGVLPLTFADAGVYDRVLEDDTISVLGLADLTPDVAVRCVLNHADGTSEEFTCNHTMSEEHIDWFRAGGALNVIRSKHLGG